MRLPVKRIHQGPATNAHLLVCKQQLFTVLYQLSHTLLPLHRPLFFLWAVLHSSYQCRDVFCHRVPKHYIYKAKKFRLKHRTNVRSITAENRYGLFRSFFPLWRVWRLNTMLQLCLPQPVGHVLSHCHDIFERSTLVAVTLRSCGVSVWSVLKDAVCPNEHKKPGQLSIDQRLKEGIFRFKSRPDHAFYCFRSF